MFILKIFLVRFIVSLKYCHQVLFVTASSELLLDLDADFVCFLCFVLRTADVLTQTTGPESEWIANKS